MKIDRVASKAVTDMAAKMEQLIEDDFLVDLAAQLLELRRVFEKHELPPPKELLFETETDFRKAHNTLKMSKKFREFFYDGDPYDTRLMGIRLDRIRRKP